VGGLTASAVLKRWTGVRIRKSTSVTPLEGVKCTESKIADSRGRRRFTSDKGPPLQRKIRRDRCVDVVYLAG